MNFYHKDAHKLRGIPLSLINDIARTTPFLSRGCDSLTVEKIISNLKISVKNKLRNSGSTTGWAEFGNARHPGDISISVYVRENPGRVAELVLHEMIHSIFSLPHGQEFTEILLRTAEELGWIEYQRRSNWGGRYDVDEFIANKLIKSGHFNHVVDMKTVDPQCSKVFNDADLFTESFSVGDRVCLEYGGILIYATVIKVNRCTVKVATDETAYFGRSEILNCSPCILSKLKLLDNFLIRA